MTVALFTMQSHKFLSVLTDAWQWFYHTTFCNECDFLAFKLAGDNIQFATSCAAITIFDKDRRSDRFSFVQRMGRGCLVWVLHPFCWHGWVAGVPSLTTQSVGGSWEVQGCLLAALPSTHWPAMASYPVRVSAKHSFSAPLLTWGLECCRIWT